MSKANSWVSSFGHFHIAATGIALLAAAVALGADVVSYGVVKIRSSSFAGTTYGFHGFALAASDNAITGATVTPPGDTGPLDLQLDAFPRLWGFDDPEYESQQEFDSAYPAGAYKIEIETASGGTATATLNLAATSYPPAPTLPFDVTPKPANLPIEITWQPLAGGTTADAVIVFLEGGGLGGSAQYRSPLPGEPGALDGTATSFVVPSNTLPPNSQFTVTVLFVKAPTRDTSTIPGAIGIAGLAAAGEGFLLVGEGGPADTTAPTLVEANPPNNAAGITRAKIIGFTFNEPMMASQSITWSANLTPAKFEYRWSEDNKTLYCRYGELLPANATITWELNPPGASGFKDAAGNALATVSGRFLTGTPTEPDPCDTDPFVPDIGTANLGKNLNFVQTPNADPLPDATAAALFMASAVGPEASPLTSAVLDVPAGPDLVLSNFFGAPNWFAYEDYASQEAMDTARPAGTYVFRLGRNGGQSATAAVQLPAAYPPTPKILNLQAGQNFNPTADFTLQWNGIPAPTATDSIFLSLTAGDVVFTAPDLCARRPLPNTATSIVIPANTFPANETVEGSLTFSRQTALDTNSIPDFVVMGYLSQTLRFQLKTGSGGPAPAAPQLTGLGLTANGSFRLELKGTAGASYAIEASTALPGGWVQRQVVTMPPSGAVVYEDPRTGSPRQTFYRARAL